MKIIVSVLAIVALATLSSGQKRFVCDPNKIYQENQCNYCSCAVVNNQLTFACTRKGCVNPEFPYFRRCNPKNPIPCDNCWCLPKFGIICEL
ncbi:hypothetical protein RN001_015511 [Aquatica leii]|uniref:Protease inhibitor n=1 Tax=Aquatica leii TaxID=1421715 RepID=A0AAN7SC33_9COLE|nr:hypothetical protein RN001_015511 [Aquatica leii]